MVGTGRGACRAVAAVLVLVVLLLGWGAASPRVQRGTSPSAAAASPAGYRFAELQGDGTGEPVAYESCRPVHYVVRPDRAPEVGPAIIASAVAEVARATGLTFVDDGLTDEAPSVGRAADAGAAHPPVLIAWSTEQETPALAGPVEGEGGSIWYEDHGPGSRRYTTGQVVLDASDLTSLLMRPDGRRAAEAVVLHELGHLVGLAHVRDRRQLMYPETIDGVSQFGAGDRAGLALLGHGRCFGN